VLRELRIGLVNGGAIGLLLFFAVWIFSKNLTLGACVGAAVGVDMLVGALVGGSIPLVLKEIGRDPAQASSIFLTTITDSLGFLSLLGLAALFLL
jgi:magnesium transporter